MTREECEEFFKQYTDRVCVTGRKQAHVKFSRSCRYAISFSIEDTMLNLLYCKHYEDHQYKPVKLVEVELCSIEEGELISYLLPLAHENVDDATEPEVLCSYRTGLRIYERVQDTRERIINWCPDLPEKRNLVKELNTLLAVN